MKCSCSMRGEVKREAGRSYAVEWKEQTKGVEIPSQGQVLHCLYHAETAHYPRVGYKNAGA